MTNAEIGADLLLMVHKLTELHQESERNQNWTARRAIWDARASLCAAMDALVEEPRVHRAIRQEWTGD